LQALPEGHADQNAAVRRLLQLEQVPEGDGAMNERNAINMMVEP
jgi:hypothetical protein